MDNNKKLEELFEYNYNEAVAAFEEKNHPLAEVLMRMLLTIAPSHPGVNAALGSIYLEAAANDWAVSHFAKACESVPDNAKYWGNLGAAYIRKGNMDEAEKCFLEALELDENYAMAYGNLGHVYRAMGEHEKSYGVYKKAYELEPDNAAYVMNVANAHQGMGDMEESRKWLEYGISKDEDSLFPEYWNNLGNIFNKMGEFKKAKECYQKMLDIRSNVSAAANKVLVNLYDTDVTPEGQKEIAVDSMKVLDEVPRMEPVIYNHDNPRIGFLSAHFGKHPCGFFTAGLFKGNTELDYFTYSNRYDPDDVTGEIEKHTNYKSVHGWNEDQLCEIIRRDEIDILFDCGGLSGKNAIKIFKKKPAPVQVGWVGFAGTRGIEEIDYLISDWYHTPEGWEDHFVEDIIRMPHDYITYFPPNIEIESRPHPLTFIAAHNSCKINEKVLSMWGRILKETDGRLIMAYSGLRSNSRRILEFLDQYGVNREKVEIHDRLPHKDMIEKYNEADLCLDTYPYSAGLVAMESMWMGVPVLTLPSRMYSGRHAYSHLKNVGLDEYIATDERDYVDKAINMAKPLDDLTRKSVRVMVEDSPLLDYKGFARDFNNRMKEIEV